MLTLNVSFWNFMWVSIVVIQTSKHWSSVELSRSLDSASYENVLCFKRAPVLGMQKKSFFAVSPRNPGLLQNKAHSLDVNMKHYLTIHRNIWFCTVIISNILSKQSTATSVTVL